MVGEWTTLDTVSRRTTATGDLMTARATKRSRSAQGGKMKRVFDAIAVLTALASLPCARAFAELYPSHLVRLMVPAGAFRLQSCPSRLLRRSLSRPGPPWMDQVQRPDFSSELSCCRRERTTLISAPQRRATPPSTCRVSQTKRWAQCVTPLTSRARGASNCWVEQVG
jgi:hypothetical protein